MIQGMVISEDGSIISTENINLAALQGAVGGYVQAIVVKAQGDRATFWMNFEGKMKGYSANVIATRIARAYSALLPGDYIAGTCVVTGDADDEGNTLPISNEWIERVMTA
jgi:hypothetical protein